MIFSPTDYLETHLLNSRAVITAILESPGLQQQIVDIAALLVKTFRAGNKLLICGNGGSCADAQHIAAEFVGSYQNRARPPLPALALCAPAVLTAVGNDSEFSEVFYRQVEAFYRSGDVVLLLSTSGESENILDAANKTSLLAIALTGERKSELDDWCKTVLHIPSTSTPIIQQGYMVAAHAICGIVEQEMFPPLAGER